MKLKILLLALIAITFSQVNIYTNKKIIAKKGDKVKVHYILKLKNGKIVDKSRGRGPFKFTIGAKQVIAGFDKAITGMTVGKEKTVTIPAKDAYGKWRKKLLLKIPKDKFPKNFNFKVGKQITSKNSMKQTVYGTITAINGNIISVDFNHPLAGKTLIFTIKLLSIN